ncbi:MAG: hypothetical protein LBG09_02980 [Puniceicoccales bacterium]|jgi:hypothetical protein|nr:hypothetical protein [Puniceicoccales bacterium]
MATENNKKAGAADRGVQAQIFLIFSKKILDKGKIISHKGCRGKYYVEKYNSRMRKTKESFMTHVKILIF